ncbi:hypothetical protein PT285_06880 [Lactobacillus sp. ESL0791]|uniref:hypothetical protein n=1 Tax=Lactobacillus sp. ESL0791 TaxID=2983234 RepID=UPI0023F6AB80|nr:hypothetical protein [Lactobacillus sp. ESL0791]MDF7639124.1 hypothetical protein [Lactobacillus sp. ESL0791]
MKVNNLIKHIVISTMLILPIAGVATMNNNVQQVQASKKYPLFTFPKKIRGKWYYVSKKGKVGIDRFTKHTYNGVKVYKDSPKLTPLLNKYGWTEKKFMLGSKRGSAIYFGYPQVDEWYMKKSGDHIQIGMNGPTWNEYRSLAKAKKHPVKYF